MNADVQSASSRQRLLPTLLLVLASLLISLLLAEGLVRLAVAAGWVSAPLALADMPAAEDEEGWEDLSQDTAGPRLYVGDSDLNHRMAANWSGFFPEESLQEVAGAQTPIHTNSLGLRSPEITPEKPAGVFRILALGDSVTFGWGVGDAETYASQLANLLAILRPKQPFEAINAGVSGYGTWQELLWLQKRGLALAPDLVVVQVHLNDAADNFWGAAGQEQSGNAWLAQHSALYRLVRQLALAGRVGGRDSCDTGWREGVERVCWERTLALLAQMQETAAGAPLLLLPAPMRWQVEPGVRDLRTWVDDARYQQVLADFAEERNLLFVDPLPAFRAYYRDTGQSLFLNVGHPNETGQRIIAQALYSGLADAGLLP